MSIFYMIASSRFTYVVLRLVQCGTALWSGAGLRGAAGDSRGDICTEEMFSETGQPRRVAQGLTGIILAATLNMIRSHRYKR